jgi:hypothetical protein
MKLDKETLIKEHFWFLLGLATFLVVLSLIFLLTTASSAIEEQEKKFKSQKSELERIGKSEPKNAEWKKSYETRFEAAEAQEKKIWEQAWLDQASMFTWPQNMPKEHLEVLTKLRFYDPIVDGAIRTNYAHDSNYKQQAIDLYSIVPPTQIKAGLRWVEEWKYPSSEEMWLAQEDIWVQRGLLQIIRETNDRLATLNEIKSVSNKEKTFGNRAWILDLALVDVGGKPGIKYNLVNNSQRRQVLPVSFTIHFGELPYVLEVHGEPLSPGKSIGESKALPVQFANARELKNVSQLFDWRTVPVKRLDRVEMGHHSSRTAETPLQPPLQYKPGEGAAADPQPAVGAQPNVGGKMPGMSPSGGTDASLTDNKLGRNRYIERSEQVRRMPVAMAVVIDQAYMQDFLAAVANSPLRIQTTQWHWQRFHDDIKPPDLDAPPSATPGTPPAPAAPRPAPPTGKGGGLPVPQLEGARPERDEGESGRRQRFGQPRPGQAFLPGPQTYSPASTAAAEEQEWDLISLAVYGIATLYERYPPATAAAPAGSPQTP